MSEHEPAAGEPTAAEWIGILSRYRDPNLARSAFEIAVTAVPFVALWVAAWAAWEFGYGWISFLLALPSAAFLVRLFLISARLRPRLLLSNARPERLGRPRVGASTLTPYDAWKRAHAIHHGTSGNLDKRGIGDLDTLTVREYRAMPFWGRVRYRLYRNPLVLFGIGPIYMFMLRHRLPLGPTVKHWRAWISPMATNAAIAAVVVGLMYLIGWKEFLLIQIPITVIAGVIGVWLFFIQHQFEDTFWAADGAWTVQDAALRGSSYYVLPAPLAWLTAHIGIHHVHHLYARIPFYRLPQVLRDQTRLASASRVSLLESLGCVRLALWDEAQSRLLSFREARRLSRDG